MVHESDWSHIASYVTGACSDEEKQAFEVRLRADNDLRETVDEALRIWSGAELEPDAEPVLVSADLASRWQEMLRKDAARSTLDIIGRDVPRRGFTPYADGNTRRHRIAPSVKPWLAAAAALAVTVGATLWLRTNANVRGMTMSLAEASMYTATAGPGQRLDIRMPDGSRVVLAAASTLRYPKTYGSARRDVYLDGRAYFEVAHDATKPFAVHAGRAVASDLGTRFDVRAYPDDDHVEVVVAEGAVELASRDRGRGTPVKSVVLGAGQLGRVDANGMVASRSGVNVGQRLAWTEGRLVFVDAALRDIVPELARWYDLDFVLADRALGERRFTGTFDHEPVAEVLQYLVLSTGASYRRNGRTITLTPNRLHD